MTDAEKQNANNTQNDLGVDFGNEKVQDEVPKPTAETYEAANRHLAPTNAPGQENVFNVTRAFNEDANEIGTIVSDKKHNRVPLGKSLKSAFNEWWGTTRKKIDASMKIVEDRIDRENPEEDATNQQDRSEIIKRATKNSFHPPTKEQPAVHIEKTKTFFTDTERVQKPLEPMAPQDPVIQKEEISLPTPPVEEEKTHIRIEKPDLRNDMVAPVIEKRIEKHIDEYTPNVPPIKEVPAFQTDVKEVQTAERKNEPREPLPPIRSRESLQKTDTKQFIAPKVTVHSVYSSERLEQPRPQSSVPLPEVSQRTRGHEVAPTVPREKIQEFEVSPTVKPPVASEKALSFPNETPFEEARVPASPSTQALPTKFAEENRSIYHPPAKQTDWGYIVKIMLLIVLGFIIIAVGFFGLRTFFADDNIVPVQTETPNVPQPISVPTFISVDYQIPILLSSDSNQFFTTLHDQVVGAENGVTQFYPIRESGAVQEIVSAWNIFTMLDLSLETNAIRALDQTTVFGSVTVEGNEPFIIIRSYNFDTLFVGLLTWEKNMFEELRPLFGTTSIENPTFVDSVKNNTAIRTLRDAGGSEILLYSFVNRNTVVITSSSAALTKILERF